jgi:DNA-binding XRE family transcriptional regulator
MSHPINARTKGRDRPMDRLDCRGCGAAVRPGRYVHLNHVQVLCAVCQRRNPDAEFRERLTELRWARNLTPVRLAQWTGIKAKTIEAYERGEAVPHWPQLARLIRVLGPGIIQHWSMAPQRAGSVGFSLAPASSASRLAHRRRRRVRVCRVSLGRSDAPRSSSPVVGPPVVCGL